VTELDGRMAALRQRFAGRCAALSGQLREALAADHRDGLAVLAHSVAGNAGLFGFAELGEQAKALETVARRPEATADELRRLGQALAAGLEDAAGAAG